MKKGKTIGQFLDVIYKVLFTFVIVFALYFIGRFVDSFAYDYFILPFVSSIILFICGVNVGRSLERIRHNESTGVFTKSRKEKLQDISEFIVDDSRPIITNKKILKELEDGDKVHVKTNQISENEGSDEEEVKEGVE